MKKKLRKLKLNRETLRNLSHEEMGGVAGADTFAETNCQGTPGCTNTCFQCTATASPCTAVDCGPHETDICHITRPRFTCVFCATDNC